MLEIITSLFINGLEQGLIISLLVMGMVIPFKLLDFPDLTAEGSYPLAGCLYASLLLLDVNIYIAMILALLAAGLAGVCTAMIHLRYKINTLLAGIIVSTMIYSINLRAMGSPNLSLPNINSFVTAIFSPSNSLLALIAINVAIVVAISWFLATEKGLRFRSVGLNKKFAQSHGVDVNKYTIFGLFLGNVLAGMAGILFVQTNQYADIGMSVGIIIQGLAAMMIGEKLVGFKSHMHIALAPIIGAILYQQIQGVALISGFSPSDMKFITGVIILLVISS